MKSKILLACCASLGLLCCVQKQKFVSYSSVEFERMLKEKDKNIQLVDVRRPDEYAAGHIDNAILIDVMDSTFMDKAKVLLNKSKPVAVYCRAGGRSKIAAKKLIEQGYKVYELDKGYEEWVVYQKNSKNK